MRHLCFNTNELSFASSDTESACKVHKHAAIFHLCRTQEDVVTCNWNGRRNYSIGEDVLNFVNQNF